MKSNKNAFDEYNGVYHQRREYILKIVVIKSPRFISGLLRVIFGIKKEEQ
ncbi:MAG: stage V sporulation protein SpoVM [Ruminococcus sp.]|nr:stage V sporulation protein SpoVM [Ruminococcus sp.]